MNDASTCVRGRATGTRTFRSRRSSFIRATASVILAFYNFVRTADDIADHATLAAGTETCACSIVSEPDLSAATMKMLSQCSCATALAAREPSAAPRTGSARRVQARRDQTALSRLGRSHQLLFALGDAGRPLCARRAWREPQRSGRPTTLCARRCRSSTICRTARTIIAISTASMFRLTHLPRAARALKRLARRRHRRRCSPLCTVLPNGRNGCSCESDIFPLLINDRRLALEVSVINTLAHRLTRMLMSRDPLSDRVHLSMPAVAGLTIVGILSAARPGGLAGVLPPRRKSRGVRE